MSTSPHRVHLAFWVGFSMVQLGFLMPQTLRAETLTNSEIVAKNYSYPEAVVSGFMGTCTSEPSQLPPEIKRQLCSCLVTEFQKQYSYDEFEAIGKAVQMGQVPPASLGATVDRCVDKVLKLQK